MLSILVWNRFHFIAKLPELVLVIVELPTHKTYSCFFVKFEAGKCLTIIKDHIFLTILKILLPNYRLAEMIIYVFFLSNNLSSDGTNDNWLFFSVLILFFDSININYASIFDWDPIRPELEEYMVICDKGFSLYVFALIWRHKLYLSTSCSWHNNKVRAFYLGTFGIG